MYLYLTLIYSKVHGQGHAHFEMTTDMAYITNDVKYEVLKIRIFASEILYIKVNVISTVNLFETQSSEAFCLSPFINVDNTMSFLILQIASQQEVYVHRNI